MKADRITDTPYDALEKIFHEPNRLSIMSAVCAADDGLTFNELKEECNLTDGNLNRHLKVLEEAGVIKIRKTFVESKPRTTIHITKTGLDRFNEYLLALSEVLDKAKQSLPAEQRKTLPLLGVKLATT
jgi:DNA-binding HxlR family transcriptional regulator